MSSPVPTAEPGTREATGTLTDEQVEPDTPWVAIVWNDPVNLMSYVTHIFVTVLGHPKKLAEKLMLDVHHKGRASVSTGSREKVEGDVLKLQAAGLWATMQQDR
ncbi:ATP-dependent Clp protease adapter ClpS [Nakamurella aerolata]|uniref:ATP-dependent Clp protease adapter protein ClpS n=1 Tax=Nakamurella aerolata TaxID=1656892 RepID=A0A849A9M5_9ACTN|nr:ATP-dependent Clp protease adapter ClpS [Nakamurella aerolata]